MVKFGIDDSTKYSEVQWKTLKQKKIRIINRETLLITMKCRYKNWITKCHPYLTILQTNEARQKFRLRSFMTKTIKMNFSSDVGFKKQ